MTEITKQDTDRFAELAAGIRSPTIIAAIDEALAENLRERVELLELRKMAVRRHGEPNPVGIVSAENASTNEPANIPKVEITAVSTTLNDLTHAYLTDSRSPYQNVAFKTREHYTSSVNRITADCGHLKLAELNAVKIQELYDKWSNGGLKKAMGHGLITMLRMMVHFGATTLEENECVRLSVVLRTLKFAPPTARTEYFTEQNSIDIMEQAYSAKEPSIALAHALQFECGLSQTDVIGLWLPLSEEDESKLIEGNWKWVRGIEWSEIQDNILRHPGYEPIDLSKAKLVMEEFTRISEAERVGPMIKDPNTGLPFRPWNYTRRWKELADKAGVNSELKYDRAKRTRKAN